jgi:hypothetical protein
MRSIRCLAEEGKLLDSLEFGPPCRWQASCTFMSVMSKVTLFKLLALAAVLLVVAVAVCAFDDDSGNDLCMVSLATLAAILMAWSLAVTGRLGPGIPVSYSLLLADPLPPPPKV